MQAGDPIFCMGSSFIYFKDDIKKMAQTAWKLLFIGGGGESTPPQGLTLQNIARVSRVKLACKKRFLLLNISFNLFG